MLLIKNNRRILMTATKRDKEKTLPIFDDIIAHILSNETFETITKELFIR